MEIKGPPFKYNIVLELPNKNTVIVDWGAHPGWIDQYRRELKTATKIMLVAKWGHSMPIVSVTLDTGKKWILFSRVFGRNDKGFDKQVRVYAIGWQKGAGKTRAKSITWVYPNGLIEVADEPSYSHLFFD